MANIPVERTSTGTPWWLWLLGLLLIAGLIWFLAGLFDDNDEDVAIVDDPDGVEAVETVETVETDPIAVTALDLSNLYVTRVPGDRTFYVAASADATEETLVVLDQNMSPDAPGIEGQVDINPGQMVDLSAGTYTALGDLDMDSLDLTDSESADMEAMDATTQVITIDGGDVEIYESDMENVEVDE